jgi:hypothetical protein
MSLSFLIPLMIALIAGYISQQLADTDLTVFWGLASVISWLLSVALAPWQLQFLLLVFLLFSIE